MSFGIRTKLLAAFGGVLLLLAIVAAFGFVKLQDAEVAFDQITDQEYAGVRAGLDAQVALTRMQRDDRQELLVTSDADSQLATKNYDADAQAYAAAVQKLDALLYTPEARVKMTRLQTAYADWTAIADKDHGRRAALRPTSRPENAHRSRDRGQDEHGQRGA